MDIYQMIIAGISITFLIMALFLNKYWDRNFKAWVWKHSRTTIKFNLLKEIAKTLPYFNNFPHIFNDLEVESIFNYFNKYNRNNKTSILHNGEYFFCGARIYNALIVKVFPDAPSIPQWDYINERIQTIQERYPRLRYVLLIDSKYQEHSFNKYIKDTKGTVFYMQEYKNPEDLIQSMANIIVDPADHPEIINIDQGKNI